VHKLDLLEDQFDRQKKIVWWEQERLLNSKVLLVGAGALGNEIAKKVQLAWDQDFNEPIQFVVGDEWRAGNLSYHLESRPTWEGFIDNKIFDIAKEYLCIDDICVGTYK